MSANTFFAIKAMVSDPNAELFVFDQQKTMYGGKKINPGNLVFVFASENEGGQGLLASGIVIAAASIAIQPDGRRQTPRVSITVQRTARAARGLGRAELKPCCHWNDGRPATELNFKFYRQATNKIVGISDAAAAWLGAYFD